MASQNRRKASRSAAFASLLLTSSLLVACGDEAGGGADGDAGPADVGDAGGDPDADSPVPDAGFDFDAADFADGDSADGNDARDAGDVDAESDALLPCSPPLTLAPTETQVLPLDLLQLTASGGTGAYQFELIQDGSGALVNELTGAYLAGSLNGAEDMVLLTDEGCLGSARSTITVVNAMIVRPLSADVPPATVFTFEVSEGSGSYGFEAISSASGGSVDAAGVYTAGELEGTDIIRVSDLETGEAVEAILRVVSGSTLEARPSRLGIPVGNRYKPLVLGGSGHFTAAFEGSALSFQDDELVAETAGQTTVTLTDRFTAQTVVVEVSTVAPAPADPIRSGDRTDAAVAVALGDVNGDGYLDGALSIPEADVSGVNSGGVYIYAGGPDGLEATPAQVLPGGNRHNQAGRALAAVDIDGDGVRELFLGISLSDVNFGNSGAVQLYDNDPDGFYLAEPVRQWLGRFSGDQFGESLATCDFNGDGLIDLAVGSSLSENRELDPRPDNQGAIYVYLAREDGFPVEADTVIYGRLPDPDGVWQEAPGLRLGLSSLAAGDLDGDGSCELVGGSYLYGGNAGIVFVYRGVPVEESPFAGVETLPRAALTGDEDGEFIPELGRWLAIGDLNGDGDGDLALSEWRHTESATDQRHGAVRVFYGGDLPATPPMSPRPASEADWTIVGNDTFDQVGWRVFIDDATGDGRPDLVASHYTDEVEGGPVNAGVVAIYEGTTGGAPLGTEPWRLLGGFASNDLFGEAVAVLGDLDQDDLPDLLVHAAAADSIAPEAGTPYYISGGAPDVQMQLEYPAEAAGHEIGRGAAVVGDLDGNGFPEVVVGAPLFDYATSPGLNAGTAFVYAGTAAGPDLANSVALERYALHSGSDWLGWAVSSAGDFDDDGFDDLAVVARFEDRPNTFGATFDNPTDCPGTRSNSGAVFVFRGRDGQLPSGQPDFVYFGPEAGRRLESVDGGVDVNGDGYDDLVLGSPELQRDGVRTGGAVVVLGRAAAVSGLTTVICDQALNIRGLNNGDLFGWSVAALGDLDADGCAEVAVGAYLDDLRGLNNQGSTRVIFGWGGSGCPSQPEYLTLVPQIANVQSAYSLGGGADVDGDGVPDLGVGSPFFRGDGITPGAAFVVPGSRLAALGRESDFDSPPTAVYPLVDTTTSLRYRVVGQIHNEQFGRSVALVGAGTPGNSGGIWVGSPLSDLPGVFPAGGAQLFPWRAISDGGQGLDPVSVLAMGGETERIDGRLGEIVRAGPGPTGPVLLMGSYQASGLGLDQGAAYAFSIADPF